MSNVKNKRSHTANKKSKKKSRKKCSIGGNWRNKLQKSRSNYEEPKQPLTKEQALYYIQNLLGKKSRILFLDLSLL